MATGDGSIERKEKIDLRILVADDDSGGARLMERMLGLKYSSAESVANGKLLLEKLLAPGSKFDFVITDFNMPQMNGIEAIKQIRATESLKDLPIIILSGELDPEPIEKAAEESGAVFLARPVNIDELYETIERMRQKAS